MPYFVYLAGQTVQATGFGVKRVRVYSPDVLLECQITATPGLQYSKSWDRNGNVPITNSSRFSVLQNGLLIRRVQVGDNGTYSCTIQYADSNSNPRSTVAKGDLIVEGKNKIIVINTKLGIINYYYLTM